MLEKIRIVLLETSHSGNIGATARAMKTMGFSELVLVSPKDFPSEQATALASNAEDILQQAKVVNSLDEAIADCQLIFGSSGRNRLVNWPILSPKEAVPLVQNALDQRTKIAILFGTERTGMTNAQLQKCHYHIHIPSDPECCSLNLSQAVQVICYELRSSLVASQSIEAKEILASSKEVEQFYQHLESILIKTHFLDPKNPRQLMTRLRRLFQRAKLQEQEVNILRGICTAIERHE
ncbi:MAG: methyltransferase [Gammaproteobacteria bacterium]|jgi:tRNA (cytidine32/uridine32-2'-O)-methyltransferase|nr:methyltransferase [Gammaproteobacteria bacterium]